MAPQTEEKEKEKSRSGGFGMEQKELALKDGAKKMYFM